MKVANFEINKIYEELIKYYLTYERALNEKFFENEEFKLFPGGYPLTFIYFPDRIKDIKKNI